MKFHCHTKVRVELRSTPKGEGRGSYAYKVCSFATRCMCNGHGNDCRPVGSYGPNPKLVCVCDPAHHTAGDNCEQCAPGYVDTPWQPATPDNPYACKGVLTFTNQWFKVTKIQHF